jgi:protein-disulfide isomerase/uncharacterized membrane protein YphA (DoxX/SURF4 family)
MKWFGVLARLVLGGVWLAAGLLKIGDPSENVRAVRAYELLPEPLVQLVGYSLPTLEIVIGVCLVLGLFTRWMGAVSAVILVAFIIGIASAWARGLEIECGCFGGGGGPAEGASDKYPWEIARDVGLLLLAAFLVWRPRTPWALDNRVLPEVPAAAPRATPAAGAAAGAGAGHRAERTRSAQAAAEIRREAAAAEQRKRNSVVTAVGLVALLAVVAVGYAVQSGRDTTGQAAAAVPSGVVEDYAVPFGDDDAPVVVQVYEDFMCPFCGQFEAASADVVERYAGADVQFRYHVISFLDRASSTRYSTRAMNAHAVVLDTAGPEVAKEFHDLLFREQPEEGGPGLSDDELIALAVQAGADEAAVEEPIRDLRFEQWVRNATDQASRDGVNSTPTIFVDGERLEQQAIEPMVADMERRIQEALDR